MSGPLDFVRRWDVPDADDFNPWPDPDAGPIARPYNPEFRDAPKPKSPGRDPRQLRVLATIHGHHHETIKVERRVQAQVHDIAKVEDTFEHQTQRWRRFIETERRENAERRARVS